MADELEAVLAAAMTGGTIFAYLAIGERFSFHADRAPPVYTKLTATKYGFLSVSETFRAAPRSTVYRIPPAEQTEIAA